MAPTTPIGSFQTARRVGMPIMFRVGQVALPRELVDHLGRPPEAVLERPVELGGEGHHERGADLGDRAPRAAPPSRPRAPLAAARGSACAAPGWSTSRSRQRRAWRRRWLAACPAAEASATWPSTSSVAGLMLSKRLARGGLDELAVDEHADLTTLVGHASAPFRVNLTPATLRRPDSTGQGGPRSSETRARLSDDSLDGPPAHHGRSRSRAGGSVP